MMARRHLILKRFMLAGILILMASCTGGGDERGSTDDPPALAISTPANGSVVNTPTVTVSGTVHDPTAKVRVNGIAATVSEGSYTATGIPLVGGRNTINATATDMAGNTVTTNIEVVFLMNFVIILTDDQRWDTLWAMPIVQEKLVAHGVTFANAFVTTPKCCPMRASLLSGGFYAQHTGVLTNQLPNGGAHKFDDLDTIATALQQIGYKTALVGKYLNGYSGSVEFVAGIAPYIPPGWTLFATGRVVGSSTQEPAQGIPIGPITQYPLDFRKEQALDFIEQYSAAPFFLLLSTNTPHAPATPAPQDEGLFQDFQYRGRAYGETDVSDKPMWVQDRAPFDAAEEDEFHRNQLRSLRAIDRAVGAIMEKVEEKEKLNQTVFIFTSDNGLMWGEHGLLDKSKPYEESLRVPCVIRVPGMTSRTDDHLVAVNLDIGPTIFDLTGIDKPTDGLSLNPLFTKPRAVWREELLIENFEMPSVPNLVWTGLRVKRGEEEWKYVEYGTGEKELYDLAYDPYEEESKHDDPFYQDMIQEFSARLEGLKGLAIISEEPPVGTANRDYMFQLTAWGGREPYNWNIVEGQLPAGLSMDSASGLITGVPVRVEEQQVSIQVESSVIARHTGNPQTFIRSFIFMTTSP